MHLINLLLAAGALVVASAIPLRVNSADTRQLSRRADPDEFRKAMQKENRERFGEAEKQPDETYKQTQEAADACFGVHMRDLTHGFGWGAGYQDAMEGCRERHGHTPRMSPRTKAELQEAAERYVWNQEKDAYADWDDQYREDTQKTDQDTLRLYGTKVARDSTGKMIRQQGQGSNGGNDDNANRNTNNKKKMSRILSRGRMA